MLTGKLWFKKLKIIVLRLTTSLRLIEYGVRYSRKNGWNVTSSSGGATANAPLELKQKRWPTHWVIECGRDLSSWALPSGLKKIIKLKINYN